MIRVCQEQHSNEQLQHCWANTEFVFLFGMQTLRSKLMVRKHDFWDGIVDYISL